MRTVVVTGPPRADAGDAGALGSFGVAMVHEALGRRFTPVMWWWPTTTAWWWCRAPRPGV